MVAGEAPDPPGASRGGITQRTDGRDSGSSRNCGSEVDDDPVVSMRSARGRTVDRRTGCQPKIMISAAASTKSPKNSREPTEISLLSDFTFLSLCRDHPGSVTLALPRQDLKPRSTRYESLPILFCHPCNFPSWPQSPAPTWLMILMGFQCRKVAGKTGPVRERSLRRKGREVRPGQAWPQG